MRTRPKTRPKQDSFRAEQRDARPSRDLAPHQAMEMIGNMMRATNTRGNPRDYVLISGARLIDRSGTYDLIARDGTVGVNGVALVHKRRLHKLMGEEYASLFWHRKLGIRAAPDAPKRWIAKHGALPLAVPGITVRPMKEQVNERQADAVPEAVPAEPGLDGSGGAQDVRADEGD